MKSENSQRHGGVLQHSFSKNLRYHNCLRTGDTHVRIRTCSSSTASCTFHQSNQVITEHYCRMQVPADGVSEGQKFLSSTFLSIYFHGITFYAFHNREFSYYKCITCARLEGPSRAATSRLYGLPKPYVGRLDFIGYILTIQLYGLNFVVV